VDRRERRPARVEIEVENEPELAAVAAGPPWRVELFLPAAWTEERRDAWREWWMRS
jgi:hypothetical protein